MLSPCYAHTILVPFTLSNEASPKTPVNTTNEETSRGQVHGGVGGKARSVSLKSPCSFPVFLYFAKSPGQSSWREGFFPLGTFRT